MPLYLELGPNDDCFVESEGVAFVLTKDLKAFRLEGDQRAPITSAEVVAKLSTMGKEISPERASQLALEWIMD
ncbi:hypothetical protein [Desulfoferula mesophila]|uniref:Uncharacterized protein n=1 Tax=Desulfoferula mesophila TaxID=3058419 RepID=A0AAU9EQE6_9BACT|nr:hypothetical protein FAK_23750 [Desulfoferula mesophilus]